MPALLSAVTTGLLLQRAGLRSPVSKTKTLGQQMQAGVMGSTSQGWKVGIDDHGQTLPGDTEHKAGLRKLSFQSLMPCPRLWSQSQEMLPDRVSVTPGQVLGKVKVALCTVCSLNSKHLVAFGCSSYSIAFRAAHSYQEAGMNQ